jgi:hypothetical protein
VRTLDPGDGVTQNCSSGEAKLGVESGQRADRAAAQIDELAVRAAERLDICVNATRLESGENRVEEAAS